jgi:hexosaminidase
VVYTSFSPFTRVVDAARPESLPARNFSKLVDAFLADPKRGAKDELIQKLSLWQDNHQDLMAIVQKSPVLKEIEPLSQNLHQLCGAGLEALNLLAKKQKPKMEWLAGNKQLILSSKKSCAEVELKVVDALEKLINAAEK